MPSRIDQLNNFEPANNYLQAFNSHKYQPYPKCHYNHTFVEGCRRARKCTDFLSSKYVT